MDQDFEDTLGRAIKKGDILVVACGNSLDVVVFICLRGRNMVNYNLRWYSINQNKSPSKKTYLSHHLHKLLIVSPDTLNEEKRKEYEYIKQYL